MRGEREKITKEEQTSIDWFQSLAGFDAIAGDRYSVTVYGKLAEPYQLGI